MAGAAGRTVLGFDFGQVRIGVAVGQELTGAARPLKTLAVREQRIDWQGIARLIADWQPDLLIVGIPRHADGSNNTITEAALRFGRRLHDRFRLPVETIDERLSSQAAENSRQSPPRSRPGRRASSLDAIAAAVIVETWLNHKETGRHAGS
jgi:putative Holliday junction resolvase